MNEARDYELSSPPTSTVIGDRTTSAVDGAQVDPPSTDENRVLTFAELKELIESGNMDKIPNNKIIPETLNVRSFFQGEALPEVFSDYFIYLHRMRLQVNRRLLQKRNLGRWKQHHHHNFFFTIIYIRLL